jgi:gamma-glutamyltranspeptidase/glutathione hydrolase
MPDAAPQVISEPRRSGRAPVYGQRGMVVSGHSAATLAGLKVLDAGGHLVDAMIAASSVLATVLGHATSLGGDCFILYHEAATGKTHALNASGTAPALATPERFPDGMKAHGPLAPVVPGLVRAWDVMHRRFGRRPWRELFKDAIDAAEAHTVSHVLATRIEAHRRELAADPGCAALYLAGGRPIAVGETLRQPALAATLRAVADNGADAFYRGDIARHIDAYFRERQGAMRAEDLAGYAPIWVEPIATEYRGHRVTVFPPNSYGGLLLMQLNGLSAIDSAMLAGDVAKRIAYQMSAMKMAFSLGVPLIGDPGKNPESGARMLSAETTARMRQAVVNLESAPPVKDTSGTSCLLLADRSGNAISVVQSVFNVFGSAFLEPRTGLLFNNRMQGFTPKPGKANSLIPGTRPAHTLCPVLVFRGGKVRFAMATPGGLSQTLTNTQVLAHLLDCRMDVAAAVEAPRWCNTRSGDFLVEAEFPEAVLVKLAEAGHKAKRRDDGYFYGSAKAIEILPSGNLAGAADHRREAFALGI